MPNSFSCSSHLPLFRSNLFLHTSSLFASSSTCYIPLFPVISPSYHLLLLLSFPPSHFLLLLISPFHLTQCIHRVLTSFSLKYLILLSSFISFTTIPLQPPLNPLPSSIMSFPSCVIPPPFFHLPLLISFPPSSSSNFFFFFS
jgi:hypothetical protein